MEIEVSSVNIKEDHAGQVSFRWLEHSLHIQSSQIIFILLQECPWFSWIVPGLLFLLMANSLPRIPCSAGTAFQKAFSRVLQSIIEALYRTELRNSIPAPTFLLIHFNLTEKESVCVCVCVFSYSVQVVEMVLFLTLRLLPIILCCTWQLYHLHIAPAQATGTQ